MLFTHVSSNVRDSLIKPLLRLVSVHTTMRMPAVALFLLLTLLFATTISSLKNHPPSTRRVFATSCASTLLLPVAVANGLDVDAFASQQLSTMSTMTSDEALCKFGQPGPARGDACVRAGLSTTATKKNKKGGGVDAYGTVGK